MTFQVRKIGLAEIGRLKEIGVSSYLPHYVHLWKPGGLEWYVGRCFGDEFLQGELADKNIEYYIAENEGESIGMMKLVLKKAPPDSKQDNGLYLEKIYFVKEWTGKGAGRKLIDLALNRAKELGREFVWLMAMDSSEKPIRAYENAGFSVSSFTRLGDEFELMHEKFRGMVIMKHYLRKNGN